MTTKTKKGSTSAKKKDSDLVTISVRRITRARRRQFNLLCVAAEISAEQALQKLIDGCIANGSVPKP